MPHAIRVIAAAHRGERTPVDTVILDYKQRSAGKIAVTGVKGLQVEIALHEPRRLRTDDLLELDDGTLVDVVAAPEPLFECRLTDIASLARLAWHLGDRHVPVQVLPNRIRVQRDEATEKLLKSLGVKLAMLEAPFEPEGGAYESSHAHHDHAHDHDHDHHHGQAHGHHHHD